MKRVFTFILAFTICIGLFMPALEGDAFANDFTAVSYSTGEWSAWTTTPITPNDRLEVETRTRQEAVYKTVYNYYHYTYQHNGTTWWTYSSNPGQGTGIRLVTRQTDTAGTRRNS